VAGVSRCETRRLARAGTMARLRSLTFEREIFDETLLFRINEPPAICEFNGRDTRVSRLVRPLGPVEQTAHELVFGKIVDIALQPGFGFLVGFLPNIVQHEIFSERLRKRK
jgi:hypothetical protein